MDPENEKIQLDDITFDDVIGGEGVETITPEAPVQEVVNEEEEEKEEEDIEE